MNIPKLGWEAGLTHWVVTVVDGPCHEMFNETFRLDWLLADVEPSPVDVPELESAEVFTDM